MVYTLMGIVKRLALMQTQICCTQALLGAINEKDFSIYLWILCWPWIMGFNADDFANSQLIIKIRLNLSPISGGNSVGKNG